MSQVYYGDWSNVDELVDQFEIKKEDLDQAEVLFAAYATGYYDGIAFVLFERGGMLYEVNGGHCSCYGLEGQWQPEITFPAAIRKRLTAAEENTSSDYYVNEGSIFYSYRQEIEAVLQSYEQRQGK